MKILVDISALRLSKGGANTYITELFQSLEKIDKQNEYIKISYSPIFERNNKILRISDTILRELWWTQKIIPKLINSNNADILHSPSFLSPINICKPNVVTFYDASILRYPEFFNLWPKLYANKFYEKIITNSNQIIAVSNFTKSEILHFFPSIKEEKIKVTHLAANKIFKVQEKEMNKKTTKKYKLVKPYLLCVSTIEPRKNYKNIIKSFYKIIDNIENDLVFVGASGWKNSDIPGLIGSMKLENRIRFLGHVNTEELVSLYNSADLFLFPSLYEGFGIPILEAMACGCPVITSNSTSLNEIGGDSALKVNPLSSDEISEGILELVLKPSLLEFYKLKGLEQAKKFSWEKTAKETYEVYEKVIGQ